MAAVKASNPHHLPHVCGDEPDVQHVFIDFRSIYPTYVGPNRRLHWHQGMQHARLFIPHQKRQLRVKRKPLPAFALCEAAVLLA